ncbi:interleukin-18-like [Menidia menidia]
MAALNCHRIQYEDIRCNSFYFQEDDNEADLHKDSFCISPGAPRTFWIQNMQQKFLIMTENDLEVRDLDDVERKQPECKFKIQIYHDLSWESKIGKPVMLYTIKDGQKMVVSCPNENEVCPEPMDLPDQIDDTGHKALFCSKSVATGKVMFESTFYKNRFLAFEPEGSLPGVWKLTLRLQEDTVDESAVTLLTHT